MVQASKKSEICPHKNPQVESNKEVRGEEISDKEVPNQEMPSEKELGKMLDQEMPGKKVSEQKMPDKKESGKEVPAHEIPVKEIPIEDSSKKELFKKGKISLHITFHNPNSEETTASFLTKVLAERVAEEMEKEFHK